MPNYTTTPGNARQLINDIYSGLIAPQGGLYQPGPPVMLPPVNIPPVPQAGPVYAQYQPPGSPYDAANDPSLPVSSAYRGGWGSGAFPTGAGNITVATVNPDGTMKDLSRLSPGQWQTGSGDGISPQLAYGMGTPGANQGTGPLMAPSVPTPPGLSAIQQATRVPGSAWTGGWGSAGLLGDILGNPGQTDWSIANQGGRGLFGPNDAPSSLPPNPIPSMPGASPAPSVPRTPAFHAALMALQQLTTPASQAAVASGQGGYVVKGGNSSLSKRGRNGNALGENAMMPTRAIDGSLRYTYGD